MKDHVLLRYLYCLIIVALLICLCIGCGSTTKTLTVTTEGGTDSSAERTSCYALIIDPESFDGQVVTVRGALYFDEGGYALYVTPEDGAYQIKTNALWLGDYHLDGVSIEDGAFVELSGKVQSRKYGPGDQYNCELDDVESIVKLEPVNSVLP